jgi:glycosyltransferase involved in cell wall biosynthesis
VPHKAPQDLLRALAVLPPEVHGVLAGTGVLEERLRDEARAPALAGRVHLLGHREDVPRLLRALDVFCLPSRLEGLGTSVLDAMAAGTPVVVSDGGGLTEMVEDSQSGLVAPAGQPDALADKLRQLLLDPVLAGRLAAGGRARVTRFSAERMVDRTRSVYEAVLRERGSARGR